LELVPSSFLSITPIIGPGIFIDQLEALLGPFTDSLSKLDVPYVMEVKQFPFSMSAVDTQEAPVGGKQTGSRLLPRSVILGNSAGVNTAVRNIQRMERLGSQFLSTSRRRWPVMMIVLYYQLGEMPYWS
jgi:hypothetical protein